MIKQIIIIYSIYSSLVNSSSKECLDFFDASILLGTESVESLCFSDTMVISGVQNCEWDTYAHNKLENLQSQKSELTLEQHFSLYRDIENNKNHTILVLYQKYRGTTGNLIVNNNQEHIAFFQTYIGVKNEIWKLTNTTGYEVPKVERSESFKVTTHKDYNFNFLAKLSGDIKGVKAGQEAGVGGSRGKQMEVTESTTFKDWGVTAMSIDLSTEWLIHQQYPFNSKKDTPQNFYDWLGKACSRSAGGQEKYYANDLPNLSTDTVEGCLISVWSFNKSIDNVVLGTTMKHGMSDWVVGSNIKERNNYHIKEHNQISEKVIYLNAKDPFVEFYYHDSFTKNITINH
ncbi:hypothetical protein ACTFIY_006578 [Dictyostelium cf. discoideum]